MARSTVHYADTETNNILKRLHNKLRPAGTPVERVEYIIELLLLRIFEVKLKQDEAFSPLRKLFDGENYRLLFSHLSSLTGDQALSCLNKNLFPFYASIMSKSRDVFSGNLPTKIQDQLVLMEEVFANSNFTNNVKGGVIAEVIGLVNEIDEQKILKTDLLGDAIESALSETGGTKDLGLFRTPGHIRRMMVEMVDPDFTDILNDPTCGTAGFLFDSFDYVIEKAQKTRQFPTESIANQFYRIGLSGIEYMGRIRKMAAVNMYIRGLNPHNIAQGDSLKMYDPSRDAGSKSVVIANPPFGAERDQPSYPNIWEEYAKESETTILFVKLMFELLEKNGRCAVIVSEGFLTWGQNSAVALRKILIQEANLRAIISLPQGVFVSKNGQGAKTSILYFEKGMPTEFVWYYKIENDGFSMGTNRAPIEGSQIPEILEIFKEIKTGNKPKDTKYSFCIPREWIETLDPRMAEKIKVETKGNLIEKNKARRIKLIDEIEKKLANKLLTKEMYDEKLWQFDNVVEAQIENEIAKQIEKAHTYHFNLQNYRSNLNDDQIKEWNDTLRNVDLKNGSNIEKRYHELKKAKSEFALQIIASFDPQNALHMDIAREYLSSIEKSILNKNNILNKLDDFLKKGHQHPLVSLEKYITPKYEKIKKEEFKCDFDIIDKISFGEGKIHLREKRETGMDLYKVNKGDLVTSKINVHQGAVAISPSDLVCSTHYQVYTINTNEVLPDYLILMLRSKKFLETINIEKAGGIKNESGSEFLSKFKIPQPQLKIQQKISEKIALQKEIIDGARKIENGFEIEMNSIEKKFQKQELDNYIVESLYGTSEKADYQEDGYPVLRIGNIKFCTFSFDDIKKIRLPPMEAEKYFLQKNDFLIVRSNGNPELVGKCAVWEDDDKQFIFASYLIRLKFDLEKIIPKYVMYYFMSRSGRNTLNPKQGGGTYNINATEFRKFQIPLPPLEIQKEIVEKLDKKMQALEGVRLLRQESEMRIEEILADVWGEGESTTICE